MSSRPISVEIPLPSRDRALNSLNSSVTHLSHISDELALPEAKVQAALEKLENSDWESDLENPRNWSSARKWTAVGIVCAYLQILCIFSN